MTKKNFSGSIEQIEYFFRALVNIYVRKLFDNELEPKLMNNRFITGPELKIFFEVYANLFKDGNSAFPKVCGSIVVPFLFQPLIACVLCL